MKSSPFQRVFKIQNRVKKIFNVGEFLERTPSKGGVCSSRVNYWETTKLTENENFCRDHGGSCEPLKTYIRNKLWDRIG